MMQGVLCCRKCGTELCHAGELMDDAINANTDSGSFFLDSPSDWMEDAAASTEGKLSCPGCQGRVGRISWVGFEAVDGRWITPAIMLTKSRLDCKWKCRDSPAPESNTESAGGEPRNEVTEVVDERCSVAPGGLDGTSTLDGQAGRQGPAHVDDGPTHDDDGAVSCQAAKDSRCSESEGARKLGKDMPASCVNAELSCHEEQTEVEVAAANLLANISENTPCLPAPPHSEAAHCSGSIEIPVTATPSTIPLSNAPAACRKIYSKAELVTMDMTELVRLLDAGEIEMDELIEACDEAATKKKEEMKKNRNLKDPQVLMQAIQQEIADDDVWRNLRAQSGQLRKNELSCAEYYAAFQEVFAKLDRDGLFRPMIELLPDRAKQEEIFSLHGLPRIK